MQCRLAIPFRVSNNTVKLFPARGHSDNGYSAQKVIGQRLRVEPGFHLLDSHGDRDSEGYSPSPPSGQAGGFGPSMLSGVISKFSVTTVLFPAHASYSWSLEGASIKALGRQILRRRRDFAWAGPHGKKGEQGPPGDREKVLVEVLTNGGRVPGMFASSRSFPTRTSTGPCRT